ncbi:MAG: hypothetical protein M0R51_09760 [Clostridia bacterium]|jgi:hypothetical protein|nr:hypothetical protein [Clostridia bacterium]
MTIQYAIDYLRAIIVNELNDTDISILSFYEQLTEAEDIERYAKTAVDLINEQNQTEYTAIGVLSMNDTADIMNLNSVYIVPMAYKLTLDMAMADRDTVIAKIQTMIDSLKGVKKDISKLSTGAYVVYTTPVINTTSELPTIADGVHIGTITLSTIKANATAYIATLDDSFVIPEALTSFYVYGVDKTSGNKLYKLAFTKTVETWAVVETLISSDFDDYKVSMSFSALQAQEPITLNQEERMWISLSGQATIADYNVGLGNDIIAFTIYDGTTTYVVEPTEISSGVGADDDTWQEVSTGYPTKSRVVSSGNSIQYTFVYDRNSALLKSFYIYGRKNYLALPDNTYTITEYEWSHGVMIKTEIDAKLVDVKVQNTNGDIITISCSFKGTA